MPSFIAPPGIASVTAGANMSVTPSGGGVAVATVENPDFTTSVTTPTLDVTGTATLDAATVTTTLSADTLSAGAGGVSTTGPIDAGSLLIAGDAQAHDIHLTGAPAATHTLQVTAAAGQSVSPFLVEDAAALPILELFLDGGVSGEFNVNPASFGFTPFAVNALVGGASNSEVRIQAGGFPGSPAALEIVCEHGADMIDCAAGSGAGIVFASPNGTKWRLTITNAGATQVVAA